MLKMKFKSTLKWKYIHHAPTSSSSEDISLQMKEKRNLKISHKNMNVNFKYKDSCSQKSDQDETILSSIKIYKIDKNAALATIIFSLIQYFFIVIKKTKTSANTPYKNDITFHTFSSDFYFEHLDSVSQSQFYFSLGLQKHYFFQ